MMRKRFIPILLAVLVCMAALPPAALAAEPDHSEGQAGLALLQSLLPEDGLEEIKITGEAEATEKYAALPAYDWTICLYVCGTDLEEKGSFATQNILQMIATDIPENVKLLVMTGGTRQWDPEGLGAGNTAYKKPSNISTQLYEITDNEMVLVKDYKENMNMGDPQTLAAFLEDCLSLAPAERMMLSFWNHGGGPLMGVALDGYTGDILSLAELDAALRGLQTARGGEKLELLGFDACLMNNLETAYVLSPYCDYMVASEQTEPAPGWNYAWLDSLEEEYSDGDGTDTLEAEELGRVIVDTYAGSMNEEGDWSQLGDETLALVDLSRMEDLAAAFNEMAFQMNLLVHNDQLFAQVSRMSEKVQHMMDDYGLLDLYDFAGGLLPYVPAAQGVLDVLGTSPGTEPEDYVGEVVGEDPAVVYRGTGAGHDRCLGMAFFYPTSKTALGTTSAGQLLNCVSIYRSFGLSDYYTSYLISVLLRVGQLRSFEGGMSTQYNSDTGHYLLQIEDPDDAFSLKSMEFINTYTKFENGKRGETYLLGSAAVTEDWDNGRFTEQFDGFWYTLGGQLASAELQTQGPYEVLAVPAYIEGEDELCVITALRMASVADSPFCIMGYTIVSSGEGGSTRTYSPQGSFTFRPVLTGFDLDAKEENGEYQAGSPITVEPDQEGGYSLAGILERKPLISGQEALYCGYFSGTDMQNQVHLSDPVGYVVLDSLSQLTAVPIPDQRYTGKPVEPKISLLFLGQEVLVEGQDYQVAYQNNVNLGTATAVVTSLRDDISGSLTVKFTITNPLEAVQSAIQSLREELPNSSWSKEELGKYGDLVDEIYMDYCRLTQNERDQLTGAQRKKLESAYSAAYSVYPSVSMKSQMAKGRTMEAIGLGLNLDWEKAAIGSSRRKAAWLQAFSVLVTREREELQSAHKKAVALAKKEDPNAKEAVCYSVKFLEQEAGGGEISSIPIAKDKTTILKLQLSGKADSKTFRVYRYNSDGSGFTQVEVLSIMKEGDKSYLLFETDDFGYFTVIAASGSSGAFSDVSEGKWYYEAVEYVRKKQLMSGVGGGRFQPEGVLTRAQFAQIIYQSEGKPKAPKAGFADVKPDAWYYDAVCYAADAGITSGCGDGRFGPNDPITREQMAAKLWRLEKINNKDLKDPNLILDFPDAAEVSEYAQTAMRWAVEQGIIHGKNGWLDPKGYAKRSETAQIIMNYFEGR